MRCRGSGRRWRRPSAIHWGARHARGKRPDDPDFGHVAPKGLAAPKAANSPVSGADLIPVLSLGIPGNAAAVCMALAVLTVVIALRQDCKAQRVGRAT